MKVNVERAATLLNDSLEKVRNKSRTLRQQAARSGQDVGAFVLDAVKERIAKARTLDEICVPFAQAVAAAGISDQEFDEFFERAREEVWQEKRGKAQ